jgi:hypothetical protein
MRSFGSPTEAGDAGAAAVSFVSVIESLGLDVREGNAANRSTRDNRKRLRTGAGCHDKLCCHPV